MRVGTVGDKDISQFGHAVGTVGVKVEGCGNRDTEAENRAEIFKKFTFSIICVLAKECVIPTCRKLAFPYCVLLASSEMMFLTYNQSFPVDLLAEPEYEKFYA